MRIRVLGGGWYGCHIALALLREGHDVQLHEVRDRLFAGASGANPARLHLGFHYPRSAKTRAACQEHTARFMQVYGPMTRPVLSNIYAVAEGESLLDFGTYKAAIAEIEHITIVPEDFGLRRCEGAVLTGERHIRIDLARNYFRDHLGAAVRYEVKPEDSSLTDWDWTVDCTFAALGSELVDRYEPCVTALMKGPTDRAVTIMDGPFPSLYPWNESMGLSSLTSALYTPLSKTCRTYAEALTELNGWGATALVQRARDMRNQMENYWPGFWDIYSLDSVVAAIRAMPSSAADARLVHVEIPEPRLIRVRAGKIDAIFTAEDKVMDILARAPRPMMELA